LAVIIAAVSQGRSSLALGNILGSSISNILGAFSLGLLFQSGDVTFDRSSKIYTGITLVFTTILVLYLGFLRSAGRFVGGVLVALFAVYVASIGYYIYKGVMAAPEDEDSDSDDDDSDDGSEDSSDDESVSSHSSGLRKKERSKQSRGAIPLADIPVEDFDSIPSAKPLKAKRSRSMLYHIAQLILGFLALSLSGYVLSHSVSAVADAYSLSDTVLGITVLSVATTLPEKFVAITGGSRGQNGIVVANTAGSNIFLLTLCSGVLFLAGNLEELMASVTLFDLVVTWFSAAIFSFIVFFGAQRWMGGVLLGFYFVFIVMEFVFYRK
jgi:Ca2+/Na+ antiporter